MIDDIVFDNTDFIIDLDDEIDGEVENISYGENLYLELPESSGSGETIWVG